MICLLWLSYVLSYWEELLQIPSFCVFWASVANPMYGSFIVKTAHDFDRKLMPWKQPKLRLFPRSVRVPPRIIPSFGNIFGSIENRQPVMLFRPFCQCRWCLSSDSTEKYRMNISSSNSFCLSVFDGFYVHQHSKVHRVPNVIENVLVRWRMNLKPYET